MNPLLPLTLIFALLALFLFYRLLTERNERAEADARRSRELYLVEIDGEAMRFYWRTQDASGLQAQLNAEPCAVSNASKFTSEETAEFVKRAMGKRGGTINILRFNPATLRYE